MWLAVQSYHFLRHKSWNILLLSQLLALFSGRITGQQIGSRIELTANDIQEIVNAHNFFRSIVDPPASNMQQIVSYAMLSNS